MRSKIILTFRTQLLGYTYRKYLGMQSRNLRCMSLLLMLLIVLPIYHTSMQTSVGTLSIINNDSISVKPPEVPLFEEDAEQNDAQYLRNNLDLSEDVHTLIPASGTLDPLEVEQSGYYSTGNISARTDTAINTQQTLEIDTAHAWVASNASINVRNLEHLYVINGTFDQGIPGVNVNPNGTAVFYPYGWISDSNDTSTYGDDSQLSTYDDTGRQYISVENQGGKVGQNAFGHDAGIKVIWAQTVQNIPNTDDFLLNFDFLYLRGPLDLNPLTPISGNCSIKVFIDGVPVWNMSLLTLSERAVWTDIGVIPISITDAPESFIFEIGLEVDELLILDKRYDYDNNGVEDGSIHTQYITVYFDDVSLIGLTPPTCEAVNLEFSVNGLTSQIFGDSSSGYGEIINSDFWETTPLEFSIRSNTSVSFDYTIHLLNHRFLNTSWTTDISKQGVSYIIESGQSGNLEMYTYLGFLGVYEDLTITINHPSDWDNFTIFDPFLSDVTSSCTLNVNAILIPPSILDRLGWWKITSDSPNYASSAEIERYDSGIPDWVTEDIFHSFDLARLSVTVGTPFDTPILSDPINFTWVLPNCTIWAESSSTGGLGSASSSPVTFGQTNTTAGIWGVRYLWSNGSELAYRCYDFALHHTAKLELVFSDTLATVVGQPLTVVLRFQDNETGQYILNDGASVIGHWAGPDVIFVPDIVKNWWQADFDTALVGAGEFLVNLVSAAPYFETSPLEIKITSHFLTNLDTPTGPLTPLIYGREYSFDYFFGMSYNGSGIDGATVEVTEEGSEWATVENTGNGYYSLTLVPMESSDFSIRVKFHKVGFENQTHTLSFLVNDVGIEVVPISTFVGPELTPFSIEVQIVESDTRDLVADANVTLAVYRPGELLYYDTTMDQASSGVYSTSIPMPGADTGTYTVRISVEKEHHEMVQEFSATLVPLADTNARLINTLLTYSWQIGIITAFAITAVVGQRVRKRRIIEKRTIATAIKNRFNDANNILGFLILHKLSGVPIYSKVFKGGFEEGMLSAFISAIMHFREEMEAGVAANYSLIPISEVIRTVTTGNLICAIITVTTPSAEQESRMVNYARAIGMMLDETLAMQSGKVIDAKTGKTFEWLFDDLMDANLVRRYQRGEKKFPKPLRFIENGINLEEAEGSFDLIRLVRLLASTEISEDDVYIHVLKAIEGEFILPVYPYNSDNEQFEF